MNPYLDFISKVFLNTAMAGVFYYYLYFLLRDDFKKRDVFWYALLVAFMIVRQYLLPREYAVFSALLYLVLFSYMTVLYRIPVQQAVLFTVLYYFCSRYVNQTVAWGFYQITGYDYINGGTSFFLRMLSCSLFSGVVCCTVRLLGPKLHNATNIPVNWKETLLISLILIPLIYFNHAHVLINVASVDLPFSIVLSRVAVSLCAILMLMGYFGMKKSLELSHLEDQLSGMIRMQAERRSMQKEYGDYILSKCHDLKKQLFLFKDQSEKEYLNRYMEELEEKVTSFDNVILTGNEVLDAIVNEKVELCRTNGITYQVVLDGSLVNFLNPMDMVSLFSNALDNAIEACLKVEDRSDRFIRVKAVDEGSIVCILFSNRCVEGQKDYSASLPATTKTDPGHGFRLKSIRFIAQKYNGSIHVEIKDSEFLLTVLLQKSTYA